MAETTPLTALLSWTWVALTMEVDNTVESEGSERVGRLFRISTPMWANGLRFIDDEGVTVDELRSRARSVCNIGGLERWGWIIVGDPGGPRRPGYGSSRGVTGRTVVRPTGAGVLARRLWPRVVVRVEERWRSRFGGRAVDSLLEALQAAAARTSADRMPWSPPEVHPSDGFYTHVVAGPRAGGAGLLAPLGQALTAFTLQHEEGAKVSLPTGANALRVIDADRVQIRDLPRLSGVSKEAATMATKYLERKGLAEIQPDRSITLTAAGRDALSDYRERAARPRNKALRASLNAILSEREVLASGLVPPPGGWRGGKPYFAQTQRVLADPTRALPWCPMVLHRGGWPDGS